MTTAGLAIYVSPSGSDSGPGTLSAPVASPARAQALARRVLAAGTPRATIVLRGGTYRLSQTLALTSDDSGESWQAFQGETPVLSGGVPLTGWSQYNANGVWRCAAPAGANCRHIYVNGVDCIRARSAAFNNFFYYTNSAAPGLSGRANPFAGFARVSDLEFVFPFTFAAMRVPVLSIDASGGVTFQPDAWSSVPPGETYPVNGYGGYFALAGISYCRVPASGAPVWIENALEFLSPVTPGQFYLDRVGGYVYCVPPEGVDIRGASVIAPMTEVLIQASGTEASPIRGLSLIGITFEHTMYAAANGSYGYNSVESGVFAPAGAVTAATSAVQVGAGRGVSVTGCTFRHLGGGGASFYGGTQHVAVTGCTFRDVSATAVLCGDPSNYNTIDAGRVDSDFAITQNLFDTCGAEFFTCGAVVAYAAPNFVVENNDFSNMPYAGVLYGIGTQNQAYAVNNNTTMWSNGSSISHNRFAGCMDYSSDGGAVYVQGMFDRSHPLQIAENVTTGTQDQFGSLYTDTGTAYCDVANNVCYANSVAHLKNNSTGNPDLVAGHANEPTVRYNFCDSKSVSFDSTDHSTDAFRLNFGGLTYTATMPASVIQGAGRSAAHGGTAWDNSGAPGAPSGVALTEVRNGNGAGALGIAWSAPGFGTVSGYEVRVSGTGMPARGLIVYAGSLTSCAWPDVQPGGVYTVTVRARNAAAQLSQPSPPVTITVSAAAVAQAYNTYPIWQD